MDLSRRSFLSSLGLGGIALTLPKTFGMIEPVIKKVGPPPVNAGFMRLSLPPGFQLCQFMFTNQSSGAYEIKVYNKETDRASMMVDMVAPDWGHSQSIYSLDHYWLTAESNKRLTLEIWGRPIKREELMPAVHVRAVGLNPATRRVCTVDTLLKTVRLDHGWAVKNGVIRPDEPPATYEEEEAQDEDPDISYSE